MSNPVLDPQEADRLAAAHRHCSDGEVTLLVPQPPHPSDALSAAVTLSEGQLFAPGFGPDSVAVPPIRTTDEAFRVEMPISPNDPAPGSQTLLESDFLKAGVGTGGIDLSAPPPSDLDIASATRRNSDGSHCVAGSPIAVPLEELATIGERTVRQCIADALDSWVTDVTRYLESGDAARSPDPIDATMMMGVLYRTICRNLRDKGINPEVVWPLVLTVIRNVFHRLVERVFEGK